jgi:hypothetical protein
MGDYNTCKQNILWPGPDGALGVGRVLPRAAPNRLSGLCQELSRDWTCFSNKQYMNLRESIPGSCGLEICVI